MKNRYRKIDIPQNTPEWHSFRKGKIGASMAGAILGISPFTTKLQLWEEIQFGITKPQNEAMKKGSETESIAREWVNNKLGKNYQPIVLQSIAHPDFIASLDGYYEDEDGTPHILEIKCGGVNLHGEALAGRIPEYYKAQMNHQMDLVGVDKMIYVSYYGKNGVIIEVNRDEEYCIHIFSEELAFLASLIDFKPPAPVDKDWVKITDLNASGKVLRYKEILSKIEELECERDDLRRSLEPKEDNHPRLQIGDLKIQRITRRGSIDYSKIEALKGIDLEPYRNKPVTCWRFSL